MLVVHASTLNKNLFIYLVYWQNITARMYCVQIDLSSFQKSRGGKRVVLF